MPITETLFLQYNYSVVREIVAPQKVWSMGGGAISTRRIRTRPTYRFRLRALDMTKAELDDLYGFATYHQGDIPFWLESVNRDGFEFGSISTPALVGYGNGVQTQFFMPNRHLLKTPPGLIGYWPMNEGSGTFISDETLRGNHGTMANAGWVNRTVPITSPATVYNGVNTGITCPIVSMLDGLPGLTIEAWINVNSTGAVRPIVSKVSGSKRSYFFCINADNSFSLLVYDALTGIAAFASAPAVPQTVWTLLSGTWSPEGVRLYVNGVLVASGGSTATRMHQSTGPIEIGMDTATGARYNGYIDEVRIWAYPRTEAEILSSLGTHLNNTIALMSDGTFLAVSVNVASGLLTVGSPPANNRRLTAMYTNRYKVVFAVEGETLLSQENFANALFHSDGIVLMEIVP